MDRRVFRIDLDPDLNARRFGVPLGGLGAPTVVGDEVCDTLIGFFCGDTWLWIRVTRAGVFLLIPCV